MRPNQNKQRVLEIQFLRGLAILVIMMVHAASDFSQVSTVNEGTAARALFYIISSFGVPIFVMISGFVLYHRYGADISVAKFYTRRFQKVLIPYGVYSVLYLIYAGWENGWYPSLGKSVLAILTGTSYYHLWFVRLIIQIYLLYPFLSRFYRHYERQGRVRRLLWGAMIFQTLMNIGMKLLKDRIHDAGAIELLLTFTEFIFYFFLGCWASRNQKKLGIIVDRFVRKYALPMILLYAVAVYVHLRLLLSGLEHYGTQQATPEIEKIPLVFTRIVTHLAALLVSYQSARFLMKRPGVGSSYVLRFGLLSYGCYLLHPMVLSAGGLALKHWFAISNTSMISFPILYALTVVTTFLFTSFIYKTPFGELFVGKTESEGNRRGTKDSAD